jgi:hypothetical protein
LQALVSTRFFAVIQACHGDYRPPFGQPDDPPAEWMFMSNESDRPNMRQFFTPIAAKKRAGLLQARLHCFANGKKPILQ